MKKMLTLGTLAVAMASSVSLAAPLDIAVFGDWPYGQELVDHAPDLIQSMNQDTSIRGIIHVGDIRAGTTPCTGSGLNPAPSTAIANGNKQVFNLFEQLEQPVVYTPGDNEWTDCHKTKQGSSGDPMKELADVRKTFFANPGYTLGQSKKRVFTQAQAFDKNYPTDAQFVENVMWSQNRTVFVTVNMPGSNNDGLAWKGGTGAYLNEAARKQEVQERTAAATRWLQAAFEKANRYNAKAVVVALQADMWDPEAAAEGGDGLGGYTEFVRGLADLTLKFNRPVLLLNGDSHLYSADKPLADPNSVQGKIHNVPAVPNLTRITVQGSTNKPSQWLKVTIDPKTPEVFNWTNIIYLNK